MADAKSFLKHANTARVMQEIRSHQGISRIEISRRLELDRSTITNIVTPLLDEGVVLEVQSTSSTQRGGRRPLLLHINADYGQILGIEISKNKAYWSLLSIIGEVSQQGFLNVEGAIDFTDIITKTLAECNSKNILGIGIGLSGHIDPQRNLIVNSEELELTNIELPKEIHDIPVMLENDANTCAWSELSRNVRPGAQNVLYALLKESYRGIELGLGIGINGDVYYGNDFASGEIKNPWETATVADLLRTVDFSYQVLNPGVVYLGGAFSNYKNDVDAWIPHMCKAADAAGKDCVFKVVEMSDYEVCFGAACMFIEKLYRVPTIVDKQNCDTINWHDIFVQRRIVYQS